MMSDNDTPLANDVEVGEAYVYPNPQGCSSAKAHNSQVVFGMVEHGGCAKIKHDQSAR